MLLILAVILLPIYWMVATSLKITNQTFANPPVLLFVPTFEHYAAVISEGEVLGALLNSLVVALGSTAISILLGTPAAYVLARFDFRGKSHLWFWIISNRFISPIVVALPFFLIARDLGLVDTRLGLILVYLTFNVPLVVWLCVDQFRVIPKELDEAAMVDGANLLQAFFRISLPLAVPSVAVAAILCFIFSWNEFLFALVLTRDVARTAPVEAATFITGFGIRWGPMMATGTLIVLPVLIFAAMLSRNLVRGLTMGAFK
jgi:multiple sugar transport system permease protein